MRARAAAWVVAWVAGSTALVAPAQGAGTSSVDAFGTVATATPLRIEIYEPTVPVPATPQVELNLAYSRVEASSGPAGRARASLMWPGGPVGEGLPTFAEALGFPKELVADGYPVQVNATSPGDQTEDKQEPLPGSVQRVSSGPEKTVAQAGFSSGGDVKDDDGSGRSELLDGLLGGDTPGLGDLLDGLDDLSGSLTGGNQAPEDEPAGATNPLGVLGAVITVGGMTSLSTTSYTGDKVVSTAISRFGGLELLGGVVKINGMTVRTTSSANLEKAESSYVVSYTGLSIAGVPFAIGKDGITAAGKTTPIPGLPDNPGKALEALGIGFELPQAQRTDDATSSKVAIQGLKVTIDLELLKPILSKLPFAELAGLIPDSEEAAQLKSLLGALGGLAPKVVAYLGNATSEATAVPPIELPPLPTGPGTTGTPPVTGGGGPVISGTPPLPVTNIPVENVPPPLLTPLTPTALTPGLPDLGSIPGVLLVGGLVLGSAAGLWLRRFGLLVLGGGSTCAHGLAAGLPDLRKMGS